MHVLQWALIGFLLKLFIIEISFKAKTWHSHRVYTYKNYLLLYICLLLVELYIINVTSNITPKQAI